MDIAVDAVCFHLEFLPLSLWLLLHYIDLAHHEFSCANAFIETKAKHIDRKREMATEEIDRERGRASIQEIDDEISSFQSM